MMSCALSPPPVPCAGRMLPRKVGPGLALNSIEAITSNLLTFITERSLSVGFNRINRFLSRQDRIPRPAGTQGSQCTARRIRESVWCVGVLGVALRVRAVSLRGTCWMSRDNCGTRMRFVKPERGSVCFGTDVYRLPVHVVWGRQPGIQNPTIHPQGDLLASFLSHLFLSLGTCWGACVLSFQCADVPDPQVPKITPL